jgi:adenylosuccinate lyase
MKALSDGCNLLETCKLDTQIMSLVSEAELGEMFDPRGHLGVSGEIVDAAISRAESVL